MQQSVETVHEQTFGLADGRHALYVVGPGRILAGLDIVQIEGGVAFGVERADADSTVRAGPYRDPGIAVDSHRQHMAMVVVRVAAHQIDPSGRLCPHGGRIPIPVLKAIRHKVDTFRLAHAPASRCS
jgi:hypothetical protein